MRWAWGLFGLALACWLAGSRAADPPADAPMEVTVTDADGKEVKVTGVKFGTGTRRLPWLADPNGTTPDAKKGPLVLELREPHSTTYAKGIVTFVPLGSVESIKYDYDKQVASVAVKGLTDPLVGTLQYKGVNVLTFSGTADGMAKIMSGGSFAKGHIKAVAFPDAKPLPPKRGDGHWLIQIDQPKAENPTLKAANLKFLYQFPGGESLSDAATVRKGEPFKLDESVKALTLIAVDQNTHMAVAEVQNGEAEKLVVIPLQTEKDGKTGTLAGLVGEVDAGWKLFPLHAIKGMKRARKD